LLSLVNKTPDGTEGTPTIGQLKDMFDTDYPSFVATKLGNPVPSARTVNGHALSSDVTVSKSDVGLGNVVNTGDSATPTSGGTTKFTTGGAYTELAKKAGLVFVGTLSSKSGNLDLDISSLYKYNPNEKSSTCVLLILVGEDNSGSMTTDHSDLWLTSYWHNKTSQWGLTRYSISGSTNRVSFNQSPVGHVTISLASQYGKYEVYAIPIGTCLL
jgi:hypothetical protein